MASGKVRFGVNGVLHGSYPEMLQMCRAIEDAGLEMLGVSDSPMLAKELYVVSTYCAMNTSRVRVVSAVTNPVTRHPSVTASGAYALEQLAPGRIGLGLATGDSALWGIGKKGIATVGHLKEYILAVKGLLRNEEVHYRGATFSHHWSDYGSPADIPVYVACSGPRVLAMASQVADGLIMSMGYGTENIQNIKSIIADSCAEVGRDPDELEVWWQTALSFSSSVEEGMRTNLGVNTNWMTMGSMEGKLIPEEYREALIQLTHDEHSFSATYHNVDRGTWTVQRAKELGIYDWLVGRSARLWGTPRDISHRLAELADMGVTNWLFYAGLPGIDKLDLVRKIAREVMPNF